MLQTSISSTFSASAVLRRALGGAIAALFLLGMTTVPSHAQSELQVVHNAPDVGTVDIYIMDGSTQEAKLDNFPFRGAFVVSGLPSGQSLDISLNPQDSSGPTDRPIVSNSISLPDASFNQAFAIGTESKGYQILTQKSRHKTSPDGAGFVGLLVGHQSPDAGSIDLTTRGSAAITGINYSSFIPASNTSSDEDYLDLPYEDYIFRVREGDDSAFDGSFGAALTTMGLDGSSLTVLASGFLDAGSSQPGFRLLAVPPENTSTTADEISEASNADENVTVLQPDPELQKLVVNEYLGAPGSGQDPNNDGVEGGDVEEEFIEVLNISGSKVDVSNFEIRNSAGAAYAFPGGTTLNPGEAATIFRGGNPTSIPGFTDTGSPELVNDASSNASNGNFEDIILVDTQDGKVFDHVSFDYNTSTSLFSPASSGESATRAPDGSGDAINSTNTSANLDFSPGYETDGSTPLPVEFARFDGTVSGQSVTLNWKTLSETNNAGFEVQQKTDGSFQRIGAVEGSGTTTQAQTYRYTVDDVGAGTHTFRLKQIDTDGSSTYSGTVEVQVQPEGAFTLTKVTPNPVQNTATMALVVQEQQDVTVGLYNTLGQRVRTLHSGPLSSRERHEVRLSTTNLSSGVYLLRASGDRFTETRRVTIVK